MNVLKTIQWHQVVIALLIGFAVGTWLGPMAGKPCSRPEWKHRGGQGEMKKHMMERFSRELSLSDQQKEKISAIFEARHPQMVALHEEMRPKFEAIRTETDNAIRPLLTPEQLKKFEEMQVKIEERRGNRRPF